MTWQEALAFALYELGEEHFPVTDEFGVASCHYCAIDWPCAVERWSWDAAKVLLGSLTDDEDAIEFERGEGMHVTLAVELRAIDASRKRYDR